MIVLNSLQDLEQKLAGEKFSGVIRLCPDDEKEYRLVWKEAQRLQTIFPALPMFIVKGILGDDNAEDATSELLRENGHKDRFLMLPLYWIVWRGAIPAVYKQSGMIVRDILSMFGGKDPVDAVSVWIEETMGVERGTGNFKARPGRPSAAPKGARTSDADGPTPVKLRSPWVVLGVPPESDANTVRTAYRKMSAKYHPDKYAQASANEQAEANRRMTEINAAYDALKAKKP